jgi:hypothetical protein
MSGVSVGPARFRDRGVNWDSQEGLALRPTLEHRPEGLFGFWRGAAASEIRRARLSSDEVCGLPARIRRASMVAGA